MAARYVEITQEEMEKFLKRAFRALRPTDGTNRGEIYYDLKLGKHVGVRVWTSIRPHSGMGAGRGADAIRIQLISLKDDGPLEKGKAPIVKRTQNWRDNVKKRVGELAEKFDDNEEFWENWAETRQRRGDPEKEMERQEEQQEEAQEERKEREEEVEEAGLQGYPTPEAKSRHRRCMRLMGEITSKQVGYIFFLLKDAGIDHNRWHDLGLMDITGYDHIPKRVQLKELSKAQGCMIIETLKSGDRWASEEDIPDEYADYPSDL